MDEKMLSLEQEIKIKEKALKLKEEKKLRKICPMVVFGDTANGEKEIYVAYMSEPSFPQFSKFMAASKKDEVIAMRTLARDCFVDGDKELVDDESLFLFGLMGQLSELITTRQSVLRMIYVRHYFPGVNLDTISDEEFAMLSEEALWLHEQMLISRMPVPMSLPERTP